MEEKKVILEVIKKGFWRNTPKWWNEYIGIKFQGVAVKSDGVICFYKVIHEGRICELDVMNCKLTPVLTHRIKLYQSILTELER